MRNAIGAGRVLTAVLSGCLLVSFAAAQVEREQDAQVGTVERAAVTEASGIAASRKNADVLWVHNDSGDTARVFAMSKAGKHLGIYRLSGAEATDWEDMAVGPGPNTSLQYLYAGDIGDNQATRSSIVVYRVPEPVVSPTQDPVDVKLSGVESITLVYPDGARDAETLMVDPVTRDIYIVSKRESKSRVYRAPYPQSTTESVTMTFVGELPWGGATGGDISADGSRIVVRGYHNASLWKRPSGSSLWEAFAGPAVEAPLKDEPQGEAVAFAADGASYYTVSEGSHPPVYYFAVPGAKVDAPDVEGGTG